MDKNAGNPQTLTATSFSELGIQERRDLEKWIIDNPDILGAGVPLLIITSEFDRFDKSDKRLDLLALDQNGKLVIIELKRDVAGSHADLQALRYAAFCSSMTHEDVIKLYAEFKRLETDEARQKIEDFLGKPFSILDEKPRIILAAGSFEDPEVTSCVLWLRRFDLDISCVETTPFRLPDNRIALVPRVIIPLPETKDYTVGIERKEAEEERQRTFTEAELLKIADARGVAALVSICRQLKSIWPAEIAGPTFGGSVMYWVPIGQFTRSVFGINIAGQRLKDTPLGELDVWIPPKNLADLAGIDETELRRILAKDYQTIEKGRDCIIRLRTPSQAEALVNQLKTWVSGSGKAAVV